MTYYKTKRIVDKKPPLRMVIVDKNGKVVNKNPSKDELKELEKERRKPFDTRKDARKNSVEYTEKQLLDPLKQFYEKYGRPPTAGDFSKNPKCPTPLPYQKRFGSFENAKKLVGLDIDSMIKKGALKSTNQKARFAEMIIRDHFEKCPIDLAGENCKSPCDGICPNGKTCDVKSSKFYEGGHYDFHTGNKHKEEIEIYYFLAFNRDWTELDYGWRIPGEIAEKDHFSVGPNSGYEFNIENMEKCDITEKLAEVLDRYDFF